MVINLVEELKRLVSIKSEVRVEDSTIIRENYDKIASAVADLAERAGLTVSVEELKSEDGELVPAVIATLPRVQAPSLALVSHYDVVPARGPWDAEGRKIGPYSPIIVEGKLYGRGAADDKSAIVASIAALASLLTEEAELKYRPYIVVTGDEEIGGVGVRALLNSGFRWDRVVILDAGAEYVSIGASGVVHGWIKVKGRAGHAGYPHVCLNPAEGLVRLASEFMRIYYPRRSSKVSKYDSPPGSPIPKVWGRASITILSLGPEDAPKHNRIPSEAVAGFDIRLIPEESVDEALSELYASFVEACRASGVWGSLEIVGAQPGWYAKDEAFVKEVVSAARAAYAQVGYDPSELGVAAELGGNDGTFFDRKGMPVVAFGAIRADNNIHAPGEFVYLKDLEMLKEFVKNLLTKR